MARGQLLKSQEGKIEKEIEAERYKRETGKHKSARTLSRSLPSNFSPKPENKKTR
jgi:hypothetical protein